MFTFYKVGGAVRDSFLDRKSKDIDYTVVSDFYKIDINAAFDGLCAYLDNKGYQRFLTTRECLTIRARFPNSNRVADFVLARKELGYRPGTRIPLAMPGTLKDDLERRDFTINAMAVDDEGGLIDLFNGRQDLETKILRTPLDPMVTLADDPLRAIRAVRFAITLKFFFSNELSKALMNPDLPELTKVVSTDRIREELQKCFKFSTWDTLRMFDVLPEPLVKEWLTREGLWLMPTTKG